MISFQRNHTKDLFCCLCKNEPLEALREHVSSHLSVSSESCTPTRALLSYKNADIFLETTEEPLCSKLQKSKINVQREGEVETSMEQDTTTDASDTESAQSITLEDATIQEEPPSHTIEELQIEDYPPVENGSSRDGSSPSVLEKQRQVLAQLLDDLGPPPSVMIIENHHASIREEEDEPQRAVPKNSVIDDGDDVLVIDEAGEVLFRLTNSFQQNVLSMVQSPLPSISVASAVVHTVNEGDEDCMMMDVVEL
ncbi:unnamed protein product [Strongylus vulgaris]|uniref:Uncharacterized protein n=1 Tax=Strongylus vulgaris TaxID=40348 RepID=A0A3P7INT8_STRVU|nr:unnamed protein product [Strongylus vulgaris]